MRSFFGLFLFSVFATTLAPSTSYAAHGQEYAVVSKVQVDKAGYVHIAVSGNFSAAHGCSKPYFATSRAPLPNAQADGLLRLASTALAARRPIWIDNDGCTDYGYLIAGSLQLRQEP